MDKLVSWCQEKRQIFLKGFLALLLLGSIVVSGFYFYLAPVSSKASKIISIDIPPNSSSASVSEMLEKKGLIRSSLLFRLYSRNSKLDNKIQAGEYKLSTGMSLEEILQMLSNGSEVLYTFTVPEGFTVDKIANLLSDKGLVDKQNFLKLCMDGDKSFPVIERRAKTKYLLEGYLFPDTYRVGAKTGEKEIILMMLNRYSEVTKQIDFAQKADKLGFSEHQALIIASMIEKEAKADDEREIISGIIQNRLKHHMPLQLCSTTEYALGKHKEVLSIKDTKINSPYNTYLVQNLPPGPIASPGVASLTAAVSPKKTDYLYFVAKSNGRHAFAKTIEEHNRNKEK